MPWESLIHVFNVMNKFLNLEGKKIIDIGSGDLRVSLYGANIIKADMYAVEKDSFVSDCAKKIMEDGRVRGIVNDRVKFYPNTDILDFTFDYNFAATIFCYTEPTDWYNGIEWKAKLLEKTSWLKPGTLMAFLMVDAYLTLEKPITFFMDLVAERLVEERVDGRTFILYKKYVLPPLGKYLRPAYTYIKGRLGIGKTGILIGAFNGVSAEYVYYGLLPNKYYLVDPYVRYADPEGTYSYRQEAWDEARESLISKFGKKDNVTFIQKKSEDTYSDFPDEHFDFVYIDGDHSYNHVKLDMTLWWPKVKKGGVMAGHDFQLTNHVARAVEEWSNNMGVEFSTKACPWNAIPDWWIDKQGGENASK